MNKEFTKDGYVFKKNFLNNSDKKKIYSFLKKNLGENVNYLKKKYINLENQVFHDQLKKLRKKQKVFGEIYDKINLSSDLMIIFYQKKFIDTFKLILKTDQIYLSGFMCRFDFPNDDRNMLSWHQDSPYYMQTYPKFNAGVCWVPITNNSEKNGTLQFIKKSNKRMEKSKYVSKNSLSTSEYLLEVSEKEKFQNLENLNQKFGDVSFLHMHLKHRSGNNTSEKVRMTIACRFHSMKNMNIGKEIYFYNNKKIKNKYIIKKR